MCHCTFSPNSLTVKKNKPTGRYARVTPYPLAGYFILKNDILSCLRQLKALRKITSFEIMNVVGNPEIGTLNFSVDLQLEHLHRIKFISSFFLRESASNIEVGSLNFHEVRFLIEKHRATRKEVHALIKEEIDARLLGFGLEEIAYDSVQEYIRTHPHSTLKAFVKTDDATDGKTHQDFIVTIQREDVTFSFGFDLKAGFKAQNKAKQTHPQVPTIRVNREQVTHSQVFIQKIYRLADAMYQRDVLQKHVALEKLHI